MIRVELGEEIKRRGIWKYRVQAYGVEGRSRQPLLDACRKIKRIDDAAVSREIGLYRKGSDKPDLFCSVDWGASHIVREDVPRFVKWTPHPRALA